jgi:hypothetical protein
MGAAEAIVMLANLTSAAIQLLQNSQLVSGMIQKATAENRNFTPEEWAQIVSLDDTARITLALAIKKAGG